MSLPVSGRLRWCPLSDQWAMSAASSRLGVRFRKAPGSTLAESTGARAMFRFGWRRVVRYLSSATLVGPVATFWTVRPACDPRMRLRSSGAPTQPVITVKPGKRTNSGQPPSCSSRAASVSNFRLGASCSSGKGITPSGARHQPLVVCGSGLSRDFGPVALPAAVGLGRLRRRIAPFHHSDPLGGNRRARSSFGSPASLTTPADNARRCVCL